MAEGGGYTGVSAEVEGHHTTVAQRQLHLSLCLLAGNLTRHRTVDLVSEPVLTSHSLKLQHVIEVLVDVVDGVGCVLIVVNDGLVAHHGLGRMSEHLGHIEVERLHAIALLE